MTNPRMRVGWQDTELDLRAAGSHFAGRPMIRN